MTSSRPIVIVVAVMVMISAAAGTRTTYPQCIKQLSTCSCETDRGVIDLAPLDSKDPSHPTFDNIQGGGGGDTFSYNPCTAITMGSCTDAALCHKWPWGSYQTSIGRQDSAKFQNSDGGKLAIKYTQDSSSSIVILECDSETESKFTNQSPNNEYKFTLTSRYACAGSGSSSISVGSILCIVFVCVICVYMIAGVIYMRFVKNATGVEMIPNVAFWREFPGLVKDGVLFVISPIRTKKSGYDEM